MFAISSIYKQGLKNVDNKQRCKHKGWKYSFEIMFNEVVLSFLGIFILKRELFLCTRVNANIIFTLVSLIYHMYVGKYYILYLQQKKREV